MQSTTNLGLAVAAMVMGLCGLVMGLRVQFAPSLRLKQQMVKTYRFSPRRFHRNMAFALIPGGIWFLAGGIEFSGWAPRAARDVAALLVVAGLGTQIWFMVRLPRWAIPKWYGQEEAAGFPCLSDASATRARGKVAYVRVAVVVTLVVGGTGWFLWSQNLGAAGLAAAALFGVGSAIGVRAQQRNARAAKGDASRGSSDQPPRSG